MKNKTLLIICLVASILTGREAFAEENVNAQITIIGGQKTYVAIKDETLAIIAQKFQVTVEDLMRENPQIRDRDEIYAGNGIKLPLYTAPQIGVINVPVPVNVNVTERTIVQSAPPAPPALVTPPSPSVSSQAIILWRGFIIAAVIILLIAFIIMMLMMIKQKKNVKKQKEKPVHVLPELHPDDDEALDEYEARCRLNPPETPTACWYGCEAGRKGLTAGHIKRHHGRCEKKVVSPQAVTA